MSHPASCAIVMSGVRVMRGGVSILHDVDWTLSQGACCVVLGPNGSGKSTLMRTLTGYMWPTAGSVDVLGQRLGETDVRMLRRRIAVVDPADRFGVDPDLSAVDAVLTGYFGSLSLYDPVTPDQRDHAEFMTRCVGLAHRVNHRFGLLSTGEQRRCLLARSLVHLPELLILDEPTAGLDVSGREHVLATIQQLRAVHPTLTLIMVTHHVEEIAPATDQVLLLRDGHITAQGRPDQVVTPERLSELFGCKVFVQKRSGRFWLEVLPEAWIDLLRDLRA